MVHDGRHGPRRRRPGQPRVVGPARWSLWSNRPVVVVLVLSVLAACVVALVLLDGSPTRQQWTWTLALLLAAIVTAELSASVQRLQDRRPGTSNIDPHSVWYFAAALLVEPRQQAVLIVVTYAHCWLRVRRHIVHREVFNAGAALLAAIAAWAVVGTLAPFTDAPTDVRTLLVIALAAAVHLVVNTVVIAAAVTLSSGRITVAGVLGRWDENAFELASLSLAVLVAWAMRDWPLVTVLIVGITAFLHRALLITQYRQAARTDSKTGLLNHAAWHETARAEVVRARRQRTALGLLMIDVDAFKRINDRHGHLAGDDVLVQLARTLAAEIRPYDRIGRFGGEEFVVLLTGTPPAEAVVIAERLRAAVEDMRVVASSVDGAVILQATVSIGVSCHPDDGDTLDRLLVRADTALYAAKAAGRNVVRVAHGAQRP